MAESNLQAQAARALELAEQSFLAGDVAGARRWAQSAVNLAPALPGAARALAAYDVHRAAAAGDWYAVLGLPRPRAHLQQVPGCGAHHPAVTHDAVRRQHRRLCLLVHPDKNRSAAADGAFKLVQAAYGVLSAAHPPAPAPPPPPPTATPWGEAASRFWQTPDAPPPPPPPPPAPKQPPVARPPPPRRAAAPPSGPPQQPPPQQPMHPGRPPWLSGRACPLCPYLCSKLVYTNTTGIFGR